MRALLIIILILISTIGFSQNITEKELIGKWKIKEIEITQVFCFPYKSYSLKDSIKKYYLNSFLEFTQNGKMNHSSIIRMENPLIGFEKQDWIFERENEFLLKGEISELGLIIRRRNDKYYFDFFNFMIFEMEKE